MHHAGVLACLLTLALLITTLTGLTLPSPPLATLNASSPLPTLHSTITHNALGDATGTGRAAASHDGAGSASGSLVLLQSGASNLKSPSSSPTHPSGDISLSRPGSGACVGCERVNGTALHLHLHSLRATAHRDGYNSTSHRTYNVTAGPSASGSVTGGANGLLVNSPSAAASATVTVSPLPSMTIGIAHLYLRHGTNSTNSTSHVAGPKANSTAALASPVPLSSSSTSASVQVQVPSPRHHRQSQPGLTGSGVDKASRAAHDAVGGHFPVPGVKHQRNGANAVAAGSSGSGSGSGRNTCDRPAVVVTPGYKRE